MDAPIFRAEDDERRFYSYIRSCTRCWPLTREEYAAALTLFRRSPTLRPFRSVLVRRTLSLDMRRVDSAKRQGEAVRVALGAGLAIVTAPSFVWACVGAPDWSDVAERCSAEDLEAIAAAKRARRGGG